MSKCKTRFICPNCDRKTEITPFTVEIIVVSREKKHLAQNTFKCSKCCHRFSINIPIKSLEVKIDHDE